MASAALNLLKPNTYEYYDGSNQQLTIKLLEAKYYEEILNSNGLEIYNQVKHKILNGEYKNEIFNFKVVFINSGMWINDNKCKFNKSNIKVVFNTYDNIKIVGDIIDKNDGSVKQIKTSIIRFIGSNWIYTTNGSLYRLKTHYIN